MGVLLKLISAFDMFTSLLQSTFRLLTSVFVLSFFCHNVALSAVLTIKVVDEGEPLPMAEVILAKTVNREVIDTNFTNKEGIYRRNLEKGIFEVIVSKTDYVDVRVNNIVVEEGIDFTKVIELMPRGLQSNESFLPPSSDGCD